ncbi:hypothetical protein PsorP6_010645 [Peronosclerospora sorghi]|uniref:Uncharacterized protein n=1 Tax=Peronosclerospora sorghi TaxID=230839 RepID=A0ACC0VWH4_9STRA|nr:hypothetical protein PsorP6_010645 [Peronosclerospora sorghi]
MNVSTVRRLLYLLLVLRTTTPQAADTSCPYASTLVDGETDSTAIVYDAHCSPRVFQVVVTSAVDRSLNLSNLNVRDVRSYPRVYELLLNNNLLETFKPVKLDNDMESLELGNNFITDLTACNFPRRLKYLDLSFNSFATLSAETPWPDSGELQTLLLQGNSLHSVASHTFTNLVSLQSLYVRMDRDRKTARIDCFFIHLVVLFSCRSLANTGISNLDDVVLPVSVRSLNVTQNAITSTSTKFTSLPSALQQLDLSNNLLTEFPPVVSMLTTLVELNLESNGITEIRGIAFASTLRTVRLANNPLSSIEICRSDVSVFQNLAHFTVPSSISALCSNPKATSVKIQGVPFCVVEASDCVRNEWDDAKRKGSGPSSSDPSSHDALLQSTFSARTIGIIGSTFLIIGILLSALGFGLCWNKRRKRQDVAGAHQAAVRKLNTDPRVGSTGGNFIVFNNSARTSRGGWHEDRDSKNDNISTLDGSGIQTAGEMAAWGIYETPLEKGNPVALLEPSPKDTAFHSASSASLQVRSKLKIKEDLDDLLVYEIPPEEIQMRRALHVSSSKRGRKAALGLSSVGVGSSRRKVDAALFLAEYRGYRVVIHALMRSKRQLEKRFVEQIRLSASLDHASIVHFIGVTTGCSTTTSSRQHRDSSGATTAPSMYASSGPGKSGAESRYPDMGAPMWHLGAVFEYMRHGSLATMFEVERRRREGKGAFYPTNSVASALETDNGNLFSWYPPLGRSRTSATASPANPTADWRCKLSIALDIAMGLVYLHANNHAHGRVCARKVLINEQGEAKLSAMDMLLPSDVRRRLDEVHGPAEGDFRGSLRDSAMWTMQKLTNRLGRPPKALRRKGSGNGTPRSARKFSGPQGSEGGTLGRSRVENNSSESDVSGVSSVTLDENSPSGHASALTQETDAFDENGLDRAPGLHASLVAAQREDVYAFGTFLWELDMMIAVDEEYLALSRNSTTGATGNPRLLKFSMDCPMELQELARQCWHDVPRERIDAIDVQEELVRVLEGRLTANGHVPSTWTRPSHLSSLSSLSSSQLSSNVSSVMRSSVADL